MAKTFEILITEFIAANGISVMDNPNRFKSLFLDFSQNEFRAETQIFSQFLGSAQANELKNSESADAVFLKGVTDRFHQATYIDISKCELMVKVYAGILGLKEKKPEPKQETQTAGVISCLKCGKELQKEWKSCPYCNTLVNGKSTSSIQQDSSYDTTGIKLSIIIWALMFFSAIERFRFIFADLVYIKYWIIYIIPSLVLLTFSIISLYKKKIWLMIFPIGIYLIRNIEFLWQTGLAVNIINFLLIAITFIMFIYYVKIKKDMKYLMITSFIFAGISYILMFFSHTNSPYFFLIGIALLCVKKEVFYEI